jgi:2-polyprenyl-3-methyl-5-hydroxy-6-metoxy-1,4-benzoquinol methylase
MNWQQRSYEKELLDLPGNSFADIRQNMAELNTINHLLGGHAITIAGLKAVAGNHNKLLVCEIGCGGGDNLAVLHHWAKKRGVELSCLGIDINEDCIRYAREQFPAGNYVTGDYRAVILSAQPDIVFSSLFCHHFTDEELTDQLRWMQMNSRLGFFINDLQRHWLAYFAIRWLTKIFSKSALVKNDAPLSVQRGFIKKEWQQLFGKAGIVAERIRWKWAFRWLVTVMHVKK